MKFICLGFIDANAFASLPAAEQQAMMDSCFAYDDQLRANGHFKGGEALQLPNTAKTLRYANGRVVVTDGPFAETKDHSARPAVSPYLAIFLTPSTVVRTVCHRLKPMPRADQRNS